jgi:hypothetical protein
MFFIWSAGKRSATVSFLGGSLDLRFSPARTAPDVSSRPRPIGRDFPTMLMSFKGACRVSLVERTFRGHRANGAHDPKRAFRHLSTDDRWRPHSWLVASSIELNSILGGELMDISDRNCWRLSRRDRVVRCGKRCHPHELLKSRRRELRGDSDSRHPQNCAADAGSRAEP